MNRAVNVRDAATTALLRDAPDTGLEVLLLRRHASHVFGANAYVFPGGALDAADDDAELRARCAGGAEAIAEAVGDQGFALAMAAIRECFEEADLLIACTAHTPVSARRREVLRAALNQQTACWTDIVTEMDLRFDLDALAFFAHWTTPAGPPKRYSTRFFAAAAPDGEARCDGLETTHVWWARPHAAVAAHDRGEIELMTPTRATLESLARYPDAATALAELMQAATVRVP
ncbi:NUDIX hydrolase [Salinisphaera sp. T5B8]|uniref:NUDIX hydrolase n=1 Tax=Salinisphaera sp. T5B8 TaxID=1304154 RepID=UPI00333FA117